MIQITNSLTREKEELVPLEAGKIRMYVCGPTVYNFIHIGNARPLVFFDVVARYLKFSGFQVTRIMNYTDVDDKIIQKAKEEGVSSDVITQKYILEFETDMKLLKVEAPDVQPKVTDHIPEIISIMRKQAERFGTRFITRNVTKVDFSARPFKVWVGATLHLSKTVIISTGASAKYLGLPSEKKYMNRGVSACATCDGAFFKNVEVGVIGGGDTAMEEANFLTRFASKVYVIHRRDQFRASKIMVERTLKNPKIEVIWNTEVIEVIGDEQAMNSVMLKNVVTGETHKKALQGLFLAIGHTPNTKLFQGLLDMDETGYLKTKPGSTYTNISGIFAAGDVQDHVYRQAITAAGSGCMAAIDAERWLEANP
ncbi:MAG: hypothetical protein EBZ49_06780 [Proteobacteria bacterium]|nr:hypothetical protein [Pseudomonadota bacterium]